jgi:epidermal growth factor receptor substrate 15
LRGPHWDIPPDVKTRADRYFDALDPLKRGYIHDDISGPFLLESKLPPEEVARIRYL